MEGIQEAVLSGDIGVLSSQLIKSPHLVNKPLDDEDTTLLHLAANSSSLEALEVLLQHGAQVNGQNGEGLTALHVAAMWGREEAVSILLDHGSERDIADEDDLLPLDYARKEGHQECIRLLDEQEEFHEMSMAEVYASMYLTQGEPPAVQEDLSVTQGDLSVTQGDLSVTQGDLSVTQGDLSLTHVTQPLEDLTTWMASSLNISTPSYHPTPNTSTSSLSNNSPPSKNLPLSKNTPPSKNAPPSKNSHSLSASRTVTAQSTSPALADHGTLATPPIVRRKLFRIEGQEDEAVLATPSAADLSAAPGEVDLSATILLEEFKENTCASFTDASPVLRNSNVSVRESDKPHPIPGHILRLTDAALREKLVSLGERPGPIVDSTRQAYQSYLNKILAGIQPSGNSGYKAYKYELSLVLNGTISIRDCAGLEEQAFGSLSKSHTHTKDTKTHYNYLLLNPTILDKLQDKTEGLAGFRVFVESVFYVGKGKKSRSTQHLKDAKDGGQKNGTPLSKKIQTIMGLWSSGRGVVPLELFHNISSQEAFIREACLIDTIGLNMLTNVQRGHIYGCACSWRMNKRRQLGCHLLYKAYRTYLILMPQELFQQDI